jgi:hypothetical protein
MSQLTLDVWATSRIRPRRRGQRGYRTPEAHQWGWITLPREIAAHPLPGHPCPKVGDVLPAWVCCRCGGVELSWHHVERSHACCDSDTVRHQCDRRDSWPGWARDFDAAWTPDRP